MVETFTFISSTKETIYAQKWLQEDRKEYKGVIQLVHGMQEHIGRYDEFANILAKQGYIVIGHDHLGHGHTVKNEKKFGYFAKEDGWNRLVEDIHILQNQISNQYPNLPYIIFGHSMGSLLVRTYLTKYDDMVSGVVLSGTSGQKFGLLIGQLLAKGIILFKGDLYRSHLLEYLVTGSFNKKFKPTRTKADWTTRNEQEVDKYQKDALCGINFTARGYLDLLKGTYYLSKQKNIDKTKYLPIYLFSGDHDPVGRMGKGVIRVYHMLEKAGLKDITIRLFQNGRHEMLNEVNKEEVLFYLFKWLDKIIINGGQKND